MGHTSHAHWSPEASHVSQNVVGTKWSPVWVAVVVLCVLLAIVLGVVVTLGLTGVIFQTSCPSLPRAARTEHGGGDDADDHRRSTSDTVVVVVSYPPHTIEHVILQVPSYDPVSLSRTEEHTLARERTVIEHMGRESSFEPLPPKPTLSISVPSRHDMAASMPLPPRIPRMLPFQASSATQFLDPGTPVVKSLSRAHLVPTQPLSAPPESSSSASSHSAHEDAGGLGVAAGDSDLGPVELRRVVTLVPKTPEEALSSEEVVEVVETAAAVTLGLHRFIEYVVYINLDENAAKRTELEREIDKLELPDFVPRERLSAIKRANSELGAFLSKVACLTKALSLKKNVLILEDDFRLDQSPAEVLRALTTVEEHFGNRWDVIALAQNVDEWQPVCSQGEVRVMRVLHSVHGAALLVNKLYVPRLLAYWIQRLRTLLPKESSQTARHIASVKTDLQRWDVWLTLFYPLGHALHERWTYMDDMEHATNAQGACQKLVLMPPLVRQRVAVCHVATGEYNQYVTAIQNDCYLKFLKMHHMEFFLFTDQASSYSDRTDEGAVLHTYQVEARGYPRDNLYLFHYLCEAAEQLRTFDFVYYMDVDYRVYQHPAEKQLMVAGVVATAHLHNIVEKRDGSRRHIGAPETRPESTACIRPDEHMAIYYASSFHGGSTPEYLAMCHAIRDHVDVDEAHHVTAKWLDESHLNRYLLSHPPANVLSQSYIFSERCLDMECRDPMCIALRESRLQPIMGTQTA